MSADRDATSSAPQARLTNRPDRAQTLVLRAALADQPEAAEAWREWRSITEFDLVDGGSIRLLPLVYRNLGAHADAFDDQVVGRLAGLYRMAWSRNAILFRRAASAIQILSGAGLPTAVLKGGSLAVLAYEDMGSRPMADVDVLVPIERVDEALRLLADAGWVPEYPDPDRRLTVHHSLGFNLGADGVLDLHKYSLWQSAGDDELWRDAIPLTIGGAETLAPAPADQLVLVCAHGTPWGLMLPFRWIADAIVLIRSSGEAMDWARVVEIAAARELSVTVEAALTFIRDQLGAPVPEHALKALAALPTERSERTTFLAACRPESPIRNLRMVWDRYRRLRKLDAAPAGGFPAFLREYWGLDSIRHIPGREFKAIRRRMKGPGTDSARSAS